MTALHHEYRLVAPNKRDTKLYWTTQARELFCILRHDKPQYTREALIADIEAYAVKQMGREAVCRVVIDSYFNVEAAK